MFFYIAYLVLFTFSKENNYPFREELPKDNLQVNIFDKSKSYYHNNRQTQITLKKTIFRDEDCNNLNDTYINVDVKISECQSINKGISFISNNQEGNTINISNSIFDFSTSLSERAMLVFQGTLLDIFNVTIKLSTKGQFFSSPIFECSNLHISSSPSINSLTFVDCILDSNISIFKLSNYPGISFTDLIFKGENAQCKSFLESDSISSAYFSNCNFSNFNEKSTIFALNQIKGELNFASCNFFNNKCSLFYLDESQKNLTTFDSCHFYDNNATNILSFIYLLGDQTAKTIEPSIFTDCQFSNNFIYSTENDKNRYGTVIGVSTTLHFVGTNKFTNCHSISVDQSDPLNKKNFGGALSIVHVKKEAYELANCSFDGCSATNMGGGLFSCMLTEVDESDKAAVLQLTNCNFTGCNSLGNGGGVSCGHNFVENGTQTELIISSSVFERCKSPIGGGIFFNGTVEQAVLSTTTFDNCEGKNGTAFHIITSQFRIEKSSIINHYSTSQTEYDTTCIYLSSMNKEMQITFSELQFNNNSGESIEIHTPYTDQLETVITIEKCEFNNNNKLSNEFTLIDCEHVQSSIMIFNNCSFNENECQLIKSDMKYCESLMIISCHFTGNIVSKGSILYVSLDSPENKVFTYQSNEMINNIAKTGNIIFVRNIEIDDDNDDINLFKDLESYGSSLFVEFTLSKPLSLSSFTFDNCTSTNIGSPIYVSSSILNESLEADFTNFSFTNNENNYNGGSIFIETNNTANIIIINSYFKHNKANNGGSIFIKDNSTTSTTTTATAVDISNCQFIEDEAKESGGSICCCEHIKLTISSSTFERCKSPIGGGIFFNGTVEQTVLSTTTFDNCEGKNGTAFHIITSQFRIENSYIINHYSTSQTEYDTTCIYLSSMNKEMQITFSELQFNNNSGESIEIHTPYTDQLETVITIEKCEFNNNNKLSNEFTLIDCEHVQSSIMIFNNCSFNENECQLIKSDMKYCESLMIISCHFTGNIVSKGSILYVSLDSPENKVFTYQSNEMINNIAKTGNIIFVRNIEIDDDNDDINLFKDLESYGSSLFVEFTLSKPLSLSSFTFDNCTSTNIGSPIFVSSSILNESLEADFTNFSFTNNENNYNGGSIFIETNNTANIIIINSYFKHNKANNGGSIFIKDNSKTTTTVDISNCQFIEDEAKESGGSIFISSASNTTIQSCTFTQTKASVNGKAISIDLLSHVSLIKCNINVEKDSSSSSAIYVFSSLLKQQENDFEKGLLIEGGCFTCNQKGGKAAFLIYNVSQQSNLRITNEACFDLSKEESILVVGSRTTIDVDDSVFNCDDCDGQPSDSETLPISPSSDDGNHKNKLSVGAIVAIVFAIIITFCFAFVIVYVVKKRREVNDDSLLRSVDSIKYTI